MTNFCWRNGPVEEIHAGEFSEYPLMQRRITPSEESLLMRETAGRLAQGFDAISDLLNEKSERSWPMQVLPYHLVPYWLVTPTNWSMDQQTSPSPPPLSVTVPTYLLFERGYNKFIGTQYRLAQLYIPSHQLSNALRQ